MPWSNSNAPRAPCYAPSPNSGCFPSIPPTKDVSLRYGVLSRFTAYVAIDLSATVNKDGKVHRIVQPGEPARGWQMLQTITMDYAPRSALPIGGGIPCLFRTISKPAELNPWRNGLEELERISLDDPAEVDRLLLEILQAFDEWLAEHPGALQSPQVMALVDAILEHFNLLDRNLSGGCRITL